MPCDSCQGPVMSLAIRRSSGCTKDQGWAGESGSLKPSSLSAQIFCAFQFPRLNSNALVAAINPSAITIAQNTPCDCQFRGTASQYASGISSNQKPKKLTIVGV